MHDTGIVELYTGPTMRAYSVGIASSGRLEQHTEPYNSLVIAVTESNIRELVLGKESAEWNMKTGEVRWIPQGDDAFRNGHRACPRRSHRVRVQLGEDVDPFLASSEQISASQ
jgi:hypothetical protein